MTDFKTGDRILVQGAGEPEHPRYYLAELDGRVWYRSGDRPTGGAFQTRPDSVTAYVPPAPPFKEGDRIRLKNDKRVQRTVIHVAPSGRVHTARWSTLFDTVQGGYLAASDLTDWEIVPSTPPNLREPDGTLWKPTGRLSPDGEPYYTAYNNPDNTDTRASMERRLGDIFTEEAGHTR